MTKVKLQRNGHRSHCKNVVEKCKNILANYTQESDSILRSYSKTLSEKLAVVETLDAQVLDTLETEEDITADIQAAGDFRDDVQEIINKIESICFKQQSSNFQDMQADSDDDASSVSSSSAVRKSLAKLPKLTLQPFYGNPSTFQEFWDNFNTAVHSVESIDNVTKFTYLKSVLKSQALSAISGLPLTSDSYEEAVKILKMRFGNKQLLINTHIEKLMTIPTIVNVTDIKKLREAYDLIEISTRNLRTLDVDTKEYGPVLISIVMAKLPSEIKLVVTRTMSFNERWDVDELIELLRKEIESREMCFMMADKDRTSDKRKITGGGYTASALVSTNSTKVSCVYCKRDHPSSRCTVVTDVKARRAFVQSKGRCFLCLKIGHIAKSCQSTHKCFKCNGRHHISLCEPRQKVEEHQNPNEAAVNISTNKGDVTLLQTAKVMVSGKHCGPSLNARLILDNGAQRSFITTDLCKRLNLKAIRQEKLILKGFGYNEEKLQVVDVVRIKLKSNFGNRYINIEVHVVPFICAPICNQFIELAQVQYEHLFDLNLADNTDNGSNLDIDILIGGDFYWNIVSGKIVKGKSGPVAVDTIFGYVLSGGMTGVSSKENPSLLSLVSSSHILRVGVDVCGRTIEEENRSNFNLGEEVKNFWSLESLGIKEGASEDVNAYETLAEGIEFDGDRYTVRLPWKTDDRTILPDNYKLSEGRLNSLFRRLKKTPERLKEYDDVIRLQEQEGIIESVGFEICDPGNVHYIPHREVVKEDRDTTKLRIVYDASAKRDGPSLNDCLETGPCLLPKVFEILSRFRSYKYALTSDIKSAFLNIRVHPDDRDFLRFLWVDNINDIEPKIVIKRFTSVIFGVTSSPFLLGGTVINHMNQFKDIETDIVEKFLNDLYMDDSISGAQTSAEAFDFYLFVKTFMKKGGFNLRKWLTNDSELQSKINFYEQTYFKEEIQENQARETKILGVQWDLTTDELVFSLKPIILEALSFSGDITKRYVLKIIASIFDPLGVLSPAVVSLKLLFQETCALKIDWDSPLPEYIVTKWNKILKGLERLQPIRVPRYYFGNKEVAEVEMHGFCDASVKAYAAVVYLRTINSDGTIFVNLVASKTKIAPLSETTIPRLELLSCLILSRLIKTIIKSISFCKCVYTWTDSADCLYWIIQKNKVWGRFVQNRVLEIRGNLPDTKWQHCPGKLNPADIPSKGLSLSSKNNLELWLHGPEFLSLNRDEWPSGNLSVTKWQLCSDGESNLSNENDSSALKGGLSSVNNENTDDQIGIESFNMITSIALQISTGISNIIKINEYNSLNKLLSVTSYVLRFVNNLKSKIVRLQTKTIEGEIKAQELDEALFNWILLVQQEFRNNEKQMKSLNFNLGTYIDERGLIRISGRMKNADLDFCTKHPILLPKNSTLTNLIITDAHLRLKHGDLRDTLNETRSHYYILQGRSKVKSILRKCVTCRYFESKPFQKPPMASLPDFRVQVSYPFTNTGVDYLGPLLVKPTLGPSSKLYKTHIVLYTCASSRAIHLDLVPDNTSGAFVRSLKRFASRRGIPKLFISDNAKTFLGKELKEYLKVMRSSWEYILEKSPWWGGFYERMVKTVKRTLRKILLKSKITYEELLTIIIEIEGVINSRPLCYIYSDSSTEEILTPSHLMVGRRLLSRNTSLDQSEFNSTEKYLSKRVKYLNTLINHFQRRFQKEYLTELREHQHLNNKQPAHVPEIGQVVLIMKDKVQRVNWRMGVITQLIKGEDNMIRGCRIKVSDANGHVSYLKRPVNKICYFEVKSEQETPDTPLATTNTRSARPKRLAAMTGNLVRQITEQV